MVNPRKPAAGRGRLFLLAAALAAALSGCEFFGLDIFPDSLQNVSGSIDLAARVKAQDGAALSEVGSIALLSSSATGSSYLFVLCYTDLGTRLLVLDPESLATRAYLSDTSLGTPLSVDANGNFISANLLINTAFEAASNPFSAISGKMVVATTSLTNLVISASSGNLSYDERSSDWYSSANSSNQVILSGASHYLVDVAAPSDGTIRLLLRDTDGKDLCFVFSSLDVFRNAVSTGPTIYEYAIANPTNISVIELTGLPDSNAWLTSGGIVAPVYGNQSRLVRYGYGTGKAVDSRLFDSDGVRGLSFDYDGDWHYYDSKSGRLYSMRKWW